MKCSKCGFENPESFKFCCQCGAKLINECPNCGSTFPSYAKFCPECGSRVVRVDPPAVLEFVVDQCSFKMIKVEGGTYIMEGVLSDDADLERPTDLVTLSDYYIGQTQVTQALWTAVMDSNPSRFKGENLPVVCVNWDDCESFIEKLNSLLSNELDGMRFAIPTDAQWGFAARGGHKSKGYLYPGSNKLDDVAWYEDNNGGKLQPVAQKKPNELGLYDMFGNVAEWCQDRYDGYSSQGPESEIRRMLRGGVGDIHGRGLRLCLIP